MIWNSRLHTSWQQYRFFLNDLKVALYSSLIMLIMPECVVQSILRWTITVYDADADSYCLIVVCFPWNWFIKIVLLFYLQMCCKVPIRVPSSSFDFMSRTFCVSLALRGFRVSSHNYSLLILNNYLDLFYILPLGRHSSPNQHPSNQKQSKQMSKCGRKAYKCVQNPKKRQEKKLNNFSLRTLHSKNRPLNGWTESSGASKSEPSYSDQGPVGTLSYILWGKLSTKKITVWLIFKSKRRSNTITYPRWKPQTVDFLLETHHILRRNSVCWLTSSFLCRVAQAAIVFY